MQGALTHRVRCLPWGAAVTSPKGVLCRGCRPTECCACCGSCSNLTEGGSMQGALAHRVLGLLWEPASVCCNVTQP